MFMFSVNNLQKDIQKTLKDIEKGGASESNIEYLCEVMEKNPHMRAQVVDTLNNILINGDNKAYS